MNNRHILVAAFLMLLPGLSFATAKVDWFRVVGGVSNSIESANKLQVDDAGNSYMTGAINDDFLTMKFDPKGNNVWAASFGTPNKIDFATGLAVDCQGYVYVSGVSDLGGFPNDKIVLIKYGPTGNVVWQILYDPGFMMSQAGIMAMHSGRIYIAVPVENDIFVGCFDENGTALWFYQTDYNVATVDHPIAISADAQNVWVAGRIGANGPSDFGLIRLDLNGNLQFLSTSDLGTDDTPTAIKVQPNGEVFMTGFFTKNGEFRIATIKFTNNGGKGWIQTFELSPTNNNGRGWNITTDASGNAIVVGGMSNGTDNDFITIKYNGSNGQWMWYSIRPVVPGVDEEAGMVAVDRCGNIKVGGVSLGDFAMLIYDPDGRLRSIDTFTTNPNGNDRLFFMELDRKGNMLVGGITEINGQNPDWLLVKLLPHFCSYGFVKCP